MSTIQDECRSGEDRRSGKDRLTEVQSKGEDIDKSCQTCSYAYLRKYHQDADKYEYEACSMGMIPIQELLPDNWACNIYKLQELD